MNWARAYFGIVIGAVGTLLLLDNLEVLDAGDIGTWWAVALIFGAVLSYLANGRPCGHGPETRLGLRLDPIALAYGLWTDNCPHRC